MDTQIPFPNYMQMKRMFQFTAPTALNDLLHELLFRLDVFLLSFFTSDKTVGIYGIALQVATTVKKIRQSFNPILEPVISQSLEQYSLKDTGEQLARVSYWMLSVQAFLVVFLYFYGSALWRRGSSL